MTTIESVAVRQRGAYDFLTHYENLCALQSSCPLPAVKAHLGESVLDINGDRIRAVDWMPIVNSVRINKTLEFVAVHSYYHKTLDEIEKRAGGGNSGGVKRKIPAVRSKEITYRICKALKECLCVTPQLACIELQGLPLRMRDLNALARGVAKNATLKHLSVENSRIGDDGLEVLCKGIKNSHSLTSLNFTGCSLTWKGGDTLSKVVKHQAIKRHNEAWQDSLRYRRPDLDRMSGIRRITVNCNPLLGDQGALSLAEALKDDLWLKALDLQQCGLGDTGAKALLEVLKYNTTLVVMDLRQNPMVEQEVLRSIMEQVMINCNGQDTEYKWIKAEPIRDPDDCRDKTPTQRSGSRRRRTKTLQSSFGKKTTIKVSSSSGGKRRTSHLMQPINGETVKPSPGMPWRTAQRANRYRGYPPETSSPGVLVSTSRYEMSETETSMSPVSSPHRQGDSLVRINYDSEDEAVIEAERRGPVRRRADEDMSLREMKVELEELRRRVKVESEARARADERVIELTVENARLRQESEMSQLKQTILDDDQVLDSIEQSFQQFHAFLDLLRDAGLGQLISMAGIDQNIMPFGKPSPRLDLDPNPLSSQMPTSIPNGIVRENTFVKSGPAAETEERPCLSVDKVNELMGDYKVQGGIPIQSGAGDGMGKPNLSASSKPASAKKSRVIHAKPDNYRASVDPTMRSTGLILTEDTNKTTAKFDDLYGKVLKDTEGVLSHSQANLPVSELTMESGHVTKKNQSAIDKENHEYLEEDTSFKSAKSREESMKEVRKDDGLDGLDPSDRILEHHYSESDDDIEEIDEVLFSPDSSPSKSVNNSDW